MQTTIIINLVGMCIITCVVLVLFLMSIYPDDWRNKDTVSFILALSLCMLLLMSIVETLKLLKL